MSNYWDTLITDSENESIDSFTEKASSLIRLTNDQIKSLIPQGVDHAQFAQLMKIVSDAALTNNEKAQHIRNVSGFAQIAVNIITKLI